MCRISAGGAIARVWWANNSPDAFKACVSCGSLDEFKQEIARQIAGVALINVRFTPGNQLQPTPQGAAEL